MGSTCGKSLGWDGLSVISYRGAPQHWQPSGAGRLDCGTESVPPGPFRASDRRLARMTPGRQFNCEPGLRAQAGDSRAFPPPVIS